MEKTREIWLDELCEALSREDENLKENGDPSIREFVETGNIDEILRFLDDDEVLESLEAFLALGVSIEEIFKIVDSWDIYEHFDAFLARFKGTANKLLPELNSCCILENLPALIEYGADMEHILAELAPYNVSDGIDDLLKNGANATVLVQKIGVTCDGDVFKYFDALVAHQVDLREVLRNMCVLDEANSKGVSERLDIFWKQNVDANEVARVMVAADLAAHFDGLVAHGANIETLAKNMDSAGLSQHIQKLLAAGIAPNWLETRMDVWDVSANFNLLHPNFDQLHPDFDVRR